MRRSAHVSVCVVSDNDAGVSNPKKPPVCANGVVLRWRFYGLLGSLSGVRTSFASCEQHV